MTDAHNWQTVLNNAQKEEQQTEVHSKPFKTLILHNRFNVAQNVWGVWLEAKWTKRLGLQSLARGLQSQLP